MLRIGLDQTDLNPPLGLPAGGHDPPPIMDGFHDRLYVRSISLFQGSTRVFIVSIDVVGLGKDLCLQIRDEASEKLGIPRDHIVLLATHTHSAPETNCWEVRWFSESPYEERILQFQDKLFVSVLASMTSAAKREKKVKSTIFATTEMHGLYTNRDDPNRKIDDTISSLHFRAEEGGGCVLFNQHNHPTILGLENTYYSADFPGIVSERLSKVAGIDQSNCITGACGDVSIRQVLGGDFSPERTYKNVLRYGNSIGDAILGSLSKSQVELKDFGHLEAKSKKVEVKIKQRPGYDETLELEKQFAQKLDKSENLAQKRRLELGLYGMKMWAQTLEINRHSLPKEIEMEFGVVCLGNEFALVWAPGEILAATGLKVKEESGYEHTFLSGYGNGYLGYFPTAESYANLEYEANFSPVSEEGSGEVERVLTELVQH